MKKAITASDTGFLLFGSQFKSFVHSWSRDLPALFLARGMFFQKQEVTL